MNTKNLEDLYLTSLDADLSAAEKGRLEDVMGCLRLG